MAQTETDHFSPYTPDPRWVGLAIVGLLVFYLVLVSSGVMPSAEAPHHEEVQSEHEYVPPLWAVLPFVLLLLAIAILPLIGLTEHWWHQNKNRFLVAFVLGIATLLFYFLGHPGGVENHFTHRVASGSGWDTVMAVLSNAILAEYIPFIVLLFALYVISGGISLRGDLPAHPAVNTAFMLAGTIMASFIGTTGAAMVLIRPLITTNIERRYRVHTIVFFIFMVCNCGGLLLPIGDPPLFLGYLRGVPFTWTLSLWPYWLGLNSALLVIYYVWDRIAYSKEPAEAVALDEIAVRPLQLDGVSNLLLILGVVLCVALIIPGKPLLGMEGITTPYFLREALMLLLVLISLEWMGRRGRELNRFDYHAIGEVAALFFGIFICMQVPIEILHARGEALGLNSSPAFFWITGTLSSFLDNAPTYVVFFETAASLPTAGVETVVLEGGRTISETLLIGISLGAVFMGANSYIGNGPNFMVKSIAERRGIKMPSFFGYMLYSLFVLVPLFVVLTFLLPES